MTPTSSEEFQSLCLREFSFLGEQYGFRREPLPDDPGINSFQVRFVNSTTKIIVEGRSWGQGVSVQLQSLGGAWTWLTEILKVRCPDLVRPFLNFGEQSVLLKHAANALRECAVDVLQGDLSIVEILYRQRCERAIEAQRRMKEESRVFRELCLREFAFLPEQFGFRVELPGETANPFQVAFNSETVRISAETSGLDTKAQMRLDIVGKPVRWALMSEVLKIRCPALAARLDSADDHETRIRIFSTVLKEYAIDVLQGDLSLLEAVERQRQSAGDRPLSLAELVELAAQLVETKDPDEAARLQAKLLRGFYGGEPHA